MHTPDVLAFKQFYATPLGMVVCRRLRRVIRRMWPDMHENRPYGDQRIVIGIGYTGPLLFPFFTQNKQCEEAVRFRPPVSIMPAQQGAVAWPDSKKTQNLSSLADEYMLPFEDFSVDRLVLAHALEFTDQPAELLKEAARVIHPSGKIVIVVPNRMSIWARREHTPFGFGRPFLMTQLETLLNEAELTLTKSERALFIAPTNVKSVIRMTAFFVRVGRRAARWVPPLRYIPSLFAGGVLVVEAERRMYAMTPQFNRSRKKAYAKTITSQKRVSTSNPEE